MTDLLVRNARLVATVDAARTEIAGGWVAVSGGTITALGTATPALRQERNACTCVTVTEPSSDRDSGV